MLDFERVDEVVTDVDGALFVLLAGVGFAHVRRLRRLARAHAHLVIEFHFIKVALVKEGGHLPGAGGQLVSDHRLLMLLLRVHVHAVQPCLDLTHERVLKVCDQHRVGHVLEVLLEAKLGHFVHVFRLNVQLLVLAHKNIALVTEGAATCLEVAAELDQVEDSDERLLAAAHLHELVHEEAHGGLAGLAFGALAPDALRVVVRRLVLPLGPEHPQSAHELVEVDLMVERRMLRDEQEQHLCQKVVLDSKHLVQILFHGIQSQMLLRLFLFLGSVFVEAVFAFQIDGAEGVEQQEDVREEGFVNLFFDLFEVGVLHIEPLNVRLWVHVALSFLDTLAAANIVNEVIDDQGQPKSEFNFVEDFRIDEGLLGFVGVLALGARDLLLVVHVRLVDEVAHNGLLLLLGLELLVTLLAHLPQRLVCNVLAVRFRVVFGVLGGDVGCLGVGKLAHDFLVSALVRWSVMAVDVFALI